jgi:hypothetical protein
MACWRAAEKLRMEICAEERFVMIPGHAYKKHRDLIYDVGMHQGEDAEFYLNKGFRVVGFEADPEHVSYCRGKLADAIAQGRLTIVEGAIVGKAMAGRSAKVAFYKNVRSSVWGTSQADWANRNAGLGSPSKIIEVETVDFRGTIERHGVPYYM